VIHRHLLARLLDFPADGFRRLTLSIPEEVTLSENTLLLRFEIKFFKRFLTL